METFQLAQPWLYCGARSQTLSAEARSPSIGSSQATPIPRWPRSDRSGARHGPVFNSDIDARFGGRSGPTLVLRRQGTIDASHESVVTVGLIAGEA